MFKMSIFNNKTKARCLLKTADLSLKNSPKTTSTFEWPICGDQKTSAKIVLFYD